MDRIGSIEGKAIQALPGETVTIKYTDLDKDGAGTGTRSTTVKVESTAPTGVLVSPAHQAFTADISPTMVVRFTDADSGVDPGTFAFGIIAAVDQDGNDVTAAITGEGTVDTTAITGGFEGEATLGGIVEGDTTVVVWNAAANDALGNPGKTDSDSSKSGSQGFILVIDKQGPDYTTAEAFAGTWWNATDKVVETGPDDADATIIGIRFPSIYQEATIQGVVIEERSETLDAGTVATTDFEVDNLRSIDGMTLSDVTPLAVDVYADAKNWVFLTVPEMAADAAPTVLLKSGLGDIAGNTASTGSIDAVDAIAPTITVALQETLVDDKVNITITSDEHLAARPMVEVNDGAGASGIAPFSATLTASNKWQATLDPTGDGVFAVKVTGRDTTQNGVTVGNDLGTLGFPTSKSLVFYIDTKPPIPVFNPADGATVASDAPFPISIDFAAEGHEYGLEADGKTMTTSAASVTRDLDVHNTVAIIAATLDGNDVLASLSTSDNILFNFSLSEISEGDHTLAVTAADLAGNGIPSKATFTVPAVPESELSPIEPGPGGATAVVEPTAPARLDLPVGGVSLEIPAAVRQGAFQVELRPVETGSVEVRPAGKVLRALEVSLFDLKGAPMTDTSLSQSARLSVTLSQAEIDDLGGRFAVFEEASQGRIVIMRFTDRASGGVWSPLSTDFSLATGTFSASVANFSTFALVDTDAVQPEPSPTPTAVPPLTGDQSVGQLALGILLGGLVLTLLGGALLMVRRGDPHLAR